MTSVLLALRSVLAMAVAWGLVFAVNAGGGELGTRLGLGRGGDLRLAWDLTVVLCAGIVASWAIVRLAPRAPVAHAVAFGVLALVADIVFVVQLGDDFPAWFNAIALLSVPLQVWLGAALALRQRRRG